MNQSKEVTYTTMHALRQREGISARELGRRCGIAHVSVLRLERGQSVGNSRTRAALEDYFKLPAHLLLAPAEVTV